MPVDREFLLGLLKNIELTLDTKSAGDAIETLLTIYRNILHHEKINHYRVIEPEKPPFSQQIWNILPCRKFMQLTGWTKVQGKLIYFSDDKLLDAIEILLEHRNITPCVEEWDENSKHEGKSEEQIREEKLRHKAAIERQKELDEFKKDRKKREEKYEEFKAKALANLYGQKLFTEPEVDNKLEKAAEIKTFSDSCNKK